jgi:hypothetical protein
MSVISVKDANEDRTGDVDEKGNRTYTRTLIVETDSLGDGPAVVRNATGVPQIGDAYAYRNEFDSQAKCRGVRISNLQGEKFGPQRQGWNVVATYKSEKEEENENDPLNATPDIRYGRNRLTVVADRGTLIEESGQETDDEPVVNTAGQVFDPPPEKYKSRRTLTVTRNEASYNKAQADDYAEAINSDTFDGSPPKTVKCLSITAAGPEFDPEGNKYWVVTYEFEFEPHGWEDEILNQGRMALVDLGDGVKELRQIRDREGELVSDAVNLREDGTAADYGEEPFYRKFRFYEKKPFSALGLNSIL